MGDWGKLPGQLYFLCVLYRLTFSGCPAARVPWTGLPPRRWGLWRRLLPSEPQRLRSVAGTGAPLCRIRVEPLPTLKLEPRALAAPRRERVKRLPRTPWGKGPRWGPGLGGCTPLSQRGLCCFFMSWNRDSRSEEYGKRDRAGRSFFCSLLAVDSSFSVREERARLGAGQGVLPAAVSPGKLLGLPCPFRPNAR